jgi:16S rRNA (cytosine967-C5)-methyltransferase
MSVDPVRRAALTVLVRVAEGRSLAPELDAALAGLPKDHGRSSRGFLTELVKGTLGWQGLYDHLIRQLSRRRPARDPLTLVVLRLSLHQLLACGGVPAYAAVHQAGELCRAGGRPRQVRYVNGLLQAMVRRLDAAGGDVTAALKPLCPDPRRDPEGHLAVRQSLPRWLVHRWLVRLGEEEAAQLCRHLNHPAPLTFHCLPPADPEETARELAGSGWTVRRGRLHRRALVLEERVERGVLRELLAKRPHLIVQDEGAQCATTWLAAGALQRERMALLLETAKRIEAGPLSVIIADGSSPPFKPGSFDAVLLDGPCSGTGVLRHHPEGRWRLRPETLAVNAERLLALARAGTLLLRPGGRLLYVTCSLEPEENEQVVTRLLAAEPDLEPDPAPTGTSPAGDQYTWWPQRTGTDGFFAARLRRKGTAA